MKASRDHRGPGNRAETILSLSVLGILRRAAATHQADIDMLILHTGLTWLGGQEIRILSEHPSLPARLSRAYRLSA
jgi:hypothetical protein